jgi:hypothetical protein
MVISPRAREIEAFNHENPSNPAGGPVEGPAGDRMDPRVTGWVPPEVEGRVKIFKQ